MNTAIVTSAPARDNGSLSFEVVSVTPDLAQTWLGLNTSNRKLKPGQVAAFAADMKAGRWLLNGEAVKLAGPAYAPTKLLDGQNRLHAILKAGMTVQLLVVFGVPDGAQSTMDSGTKRTVADNLTIGGIQNATTVAAAASIAMRVAGGTINGGPVRATNASAEEFIFNNPDIINSAAIAAKYAHRTDIPGSLVAYTHWVMAGIDQEDALAFWRDASEKIGLTAGDPVIALTNRFAESRRTNERVPLVASLSAIYRAWNCRRTGKTMRLVKFKSPGESGGLVGIPTPK